MILPLLLILETLHFIISMKISTEEYDYSISNYDNYEEIANYTGAQVLNVKLRGETDLLFINNLVDREGIKLWKLTSSFAQLLTWLKSRRKIKRLLRSRSLNYTILVKDVQKRIDDEQTEIDILNDASLRFDQKMDWNRCHKYEDIIAFLNYLSISYPNITEVKVLGKSHEEREIRLFRLSNGNSSNKAVFIESGIHAREWISVATVTYIINELTTHFDDESDDIRNIDWYFVPIINPDGYYHTHKSTGGDRLWRKNRRHTTGSCFGVDLNRNFGYGWITKKNHGIDNCKEDYAGPHAFSEAETIAIHDFILNSAINFTAYLSYHSYGQFILYPYGYNQTNIDNYKELHDIAEGMAEVYKAVGYRYHVGNSAKMLYPASGLSNDWAASIGIEHPFVIELSDTGFNGFLLPSKYIIKVANSSLAALKKLAAYIINK